MGANCSLRLMLCGCLWCSVCRGWTNPPRPLTPPIFERSRRSSTMRREISALLDALPTKSPSMLGTALYPNIACARNTESAHQACKKIKHWQGRGLWESV
eukprot:6197560-Pleurochrysis_carterae.AAC.1